MRCPFHDDRAASASYSTERQRFRCHGCGVAGDGFALIMEVERCDFLTAKTRATEICGAAGFTECGASESPGQRSKLTARRSKERARLVRQRYGRRPRLRV